MNISKRLLSSLNSLTTRRIKADDELSAEVHLLTQDCPESTSFPERIWLLKKGQSVPPHCPNGNKMKFKDGWAGYQFCGIASKCACAHKNHSEKISKAKREMSSDDISRANSKRSETVMKKYGVEHISQDAGFRDTVEQTCMERFGAKSNLSTSDTRDKIEKTNQSRYGEKYPTKNDLVKKKIIATKVARNGEDWSKIESEKARETMTNRYGHPHALQVQSFKDKRKKTNVDRWGHENHMRNPALIEKIRATCVRRYGSPSTRQIGYSSDDLKLVNDFDFFKEKYEEFGVLGLLEKYNISRAVIRNCLVKFDLPRDLNLTFPEEVISNILIDLGVEYLVRSRSIIPPLELDFYIPERKLAIEVCGLYWHSEMGGKKDRNYHLRKTEMCEELGIRLITIFDDEIDKTEIVRARLSHFLGKGSRVCGARQTTIREIDVGECREFLEQHHVQGYSPSTIRLGAFYQDELVGVMTLGKQRVALGAKNPSNSAWEIMRMANRGVVGLNSKLFSHFIKNYDAEEIISYCDRRWGQGGTYREMGMTFQHNSKPNYWYMDKTKSKRYHRYSFTKSKLVKEGFDQTQSEWKIMVGRGFDRIWDCGNSKWVWNRAL